MDANHFHTVDAFVRIFPDSRALGKLVPDGF